MDIGVFTPEQARTLWQWYLRSVAGGGTLQDKGPRPLGTPADYCVILDAALAAATNSKIGPTSCLATICVWDVEEEKFDETEEQITVWNHSESTSHEQDTFGFAQWVASHWVFFGDCEAMSDRDAT